MPSVTCAGRRGALALLFNGSAAAAAPRSDRLVALDAPAAEMLLALGRAPVAMTDPALFRLTQPWAGLPAGVRNLGHYYEPNLELLQDLAPELCIGTFPSNATAERLARIAPLLHLPIYGAGAPALPAAVTALRSLSARLAAAAAGDAVIARAEAAFSFPLVAPRPPVLLLTLLPDARHVVVYGRNSLFHAVMARRGLANAWPEGGSAWGITQTGLAALADHPQADILHIGSPATAATLARLAANRFWTSLPAVRAGRVAGLPFLEMYGALPTALRFAELLGPALDRLDHGG